MTDGEAKVAIVWYHGLRIAAREMAQRLFDKMRRAGSRGEVLTVRVEGDGSTKRGREGAMYQDARFGYINDSSIYATVVTFMGNFIPT